MIGYPRCVFGCPRLTAAAPVGFYDDDDFKALAIMFDKFGQLILYHLPKVNIWSALK